MRQNLQVEEKRRKQAENELLNIKKIVPESEDAIEVNIIWFLYLIKHHACSDTCVFWDFISRLSTGKKTVHAGNK